MLPSSLEFKIKILFNFNKIMALNLNKINFTSWGWELVVKIFLLPSQNKYYTTIGGVYQK
jgi:hypothetical protein